MAYSLTWLSQVLRDAGLKVIECDGWRDSGHGDMKAALGVLCHYTGDLRKGNMPSLDVLVNGRNGKDALKGPLSQLGLGRDGTYYVIAAGKCWHAGPVGPEGWKDITDGNGHLIGIEAENRGDKNTDPWPEVQLDAYRRGVAAILLHIKQSDVSWCAGHKEWAKGRKTNPKFDPNFDMDDFRAAVKAIMDGKVPIETPVPKATLARGKNNDPNLVTLVQAKVGVTADGIFGSATEAAIRSFQANNHLDPDGIVGAKTWALI